MLWRHAQQGLSVSPSLPLLAPALRRRAAVENSHNSLILLILNCERKLRQRILIVGVYPKLRHENVAAKTL